MFSSKADYILNEPDLSAIVPKPEKYIHNFKYKIEGLQAQSRAEIAESSLSSFGV